MLMYAKKTYVVSVSLGKVKNLLSVQKFAYFLLQWCLHCACFGFKTFSVCFLRYSGYKKYLYLRKLYWCQCSKLHCLVQYYIHTHILFDRTHSRAPSGASHHSVSSTTDTVSTLENGQVFLSFFTYFTVNSRSREEIILTHHFKQWE